MTVKELKAFLKTLPKELNEFNVVFSEVKTLDESRWARKDIPLQSAVVDSASEELILATQSTVDDMIKFSGQE
jgi:hypothetical protein